jgi:hypothetical protein
MYTGETIKTVMAQPSGMYIRTMTEGHGGQTKYLARTFLMGMTMQKKTCFSKEEASSWLADRVLEGGFDRISLEVIEDGSPGRA